MSAIDALNQIVVDGVKRGLVHNFTEDEHLTGSRITMGNEELINFGSCSYLGLEYSPILKNGVMNALNRYGTQFSTSRTYLSLGIYAELEAELEKIFMKPLIVTASTTLGHLAALPVVVNDDDAVILDLQVHSSVQMATQILKARKISTHIIPHNSMSSLESKIKILQNKHKKIWYLADGIYSMYGDTAPMQEIERLLNTYNKFHLYIDDAHGMGWAGKNGAGYVRSQIEHHNKMILATSLNKSFAAAGGLLVFPDESLKTKVKNCGSTLIFSGPIQPPMLGAALASAKFHQTVDFQQIQKNLREKVAYVNRRLEELNLPQYEKSESPLFFIPVGLPRVSCTVIERMKRQGFYMNTAAFPAVPMKRSGIRFMVNANLSYDEIESMLVTLQREYILGLTEEGSNTEEVAKNFKIPSFEIILKDNNMNEVVSFDSDLKEELHDSIKKLDSHEWEKLLGHSGSNSYENIKQLEAAFSNNEKKEENTKFYYYKITDHKNEVILLSFFTSAWVKDDMLFSKDVSAKVEEIRKEDTYYLTSKQIMTGSLFSVGKSIYINKNNEKWKQALAKMVEKVQEIAEKEEATKIMLRDFTVDERTYFKDDMLKLGFIEYKLPNNCSIEEMNWNKHEEYLMTLGRKYRYNLRKEILSYSDKFRVEFNKPVSESDKKICFELYRNVFNQAFELNVFELPYAVFDMMFEDSNYDIIRLYLENCPDPVGVLFSYRNKDEYNALVVGLDYEYVKIFNTYKQTLYQSVLRAKALGCKKLDLAFTAELEKKKVGAKINEVYAFVQATEHLSNTMLNMIN